VPCTPTAVTPPYIGGNVSIGVVFPLRTHAIVQGITPRAEVVLDAVEWATGSRRRIFTNASRTFASPDQTLLAVTRRTASLSLFVMDATASLLVQVSSTVAPDEFVGFSQDSQFVCFIDSTSGASAGLYCSPSRQSAAIRVSLPGQIGGQLRLGTFAGDDRTVGFVFVAANGTSSLCIAQVNVVESARVIFTSNFAIDTFSFSPDSSFVGVAEQRIGITSLWTVHLSSLNTTDLTSPANLSFLSSIVWLKDNSKVAFLARNLTEPPDLRKWFVSSENDFGELVSVLRLSTSRSKFRCPSVGERKC
jgi:Tol biopolymer transport system component